MSVPKLRFPEFRGAGEWKTNELGQIASFYKGKGLPKSELDLLGDNACIHYGQLFTEYMEVIDSIISKTNSNGYDYFKSVKNDVLMPTSDVTPKGLAKASCINLDGVILGGDILVIRTNPKQVHGAFLSRFIRHKEHEVLKLVSGSTVFHLYGSALAKMQVVLPPFQEQQKIADCLGSLDELITAENQKLETLKQHKKGLMQQLFPQAGETTPRLRFPKFRDAEAWADTTLGLVAKFLKGKGISKADIDSGGQLPCIRYGELYTRYNEIISTVISRTNINSADLVLSRENDVIIPSSGETQIDIATASCVMQSGVALGGDLNIIRSKNNGVFLSYYLNNAKKEAIAELAQGISVVHLYSSQLNTLKISIPKLPEQQKIANCLSSLDELITAQSQKIEALKLHKKSLMQGLFPNIDAQV